MEKVQSIFNEKATEKLRSPDDLDTCIKVTSPSVWAVLLSCVALLLGLLAWGVFGTVSTNVDATGVCVDDDVMCFLNADDFSKVEVGNTAQVDGQSMVVSSKGAVPESKEELKEQVKSDYLVSTLASGDWSYVVSFSGDGSKLPRSLPLTVVISTERVSPMALIMGN